jgi:8-oxo-dGTP pyrophosphatase MutT (NUDIX family)
MRWKIHSTKPIYDSPWVRLRVDDVELPGGQRIEHHVLEFPKPSVGAVVVDSAGRILLLWRHRHITDASGWEIPAGWAEPGEDLASAVVREVQEETGYHIREVRPIAEYHPLSGISTMRYTVYLGTQPTKVQEPELIETERVEWFAAEDVRKLLATGQVVDGPSLTGLAYYLSTSEEGPI